MAAYSGLSGNVVYNGTTIAKIRDWMIETSRPFEKSYARGSTWTGWTPGDREWRGEAVFIWDDSLSSITLDGIRATTALAAVFNSGGAGSLKLYGNVWVEEESIESRDDDPVGWRARFLGEGELKEGVV